MENCNHSCSSDQVILERFRNALVDQNYWLIVTDEPWVAASLDFIAGLIDSTSLDPDVAFIRVSIHVLDLAKQVPFTGLALSKKIMRPHDAAVTVAGVSRRQPEQVLETINEGQDLFAISEDPGQLGNILESIRRGLIVNESPLAN